MIVSTAAECQRFHELVKLRGGALGPGLSPEAASRFEAFLRRAVRLAERICNAPSTVSQPKLNIGWIQDDRVGACSFVAHGEDYVGINAGTLVVFQAVFGWICSHPGLLLFLDLPNMQSAPLPLGRLSTRYSNLTKGAPQEPPKDKTRRECAEVLICMCFDLVVAHELTHLRNGHVDFLGALDRGDFPEVVREPVTYQALEMDADSLAIWRTAQPIMASLRNPGWREDHFFAQLPWLNSPEKWLYVLVFAVSAVFRLEDELWWPTQDLEHQRHLPAMVRQRITLSAMTTQIMNWLPELMPAFSTAVKHVVRECELAFAKIVGLEEADFTGIHGAFSEQVSERMEQLSGRWEMIRPHLVERARTTNLPR